MKKVNSKQEKFSDWCIEFLKRNYVYLLMIGLIILRIAIGYAMGGWFGISETYDDVAMMKGLSLDRLLHPTHLSLIKDLSYSVFLAFSAITNLPYTVVLAGFWGLTAFAAWCLVRKVNDNKWVQFAVFSYVLFLPIAFTSWGGLRIYRNAIIAPSIIMTFCLALRLMIGIIQGERKKKAVWNAIATGVMFAFTYFLKEDGIWLKACMIVILLVCIIIIVYKYKKDKKSTIDSRIREAVKWTTICLIPFMVLFVWDNVYRGVNYAFFGVYEINTRTEGELGEFVEKIYKIDSPNRTNIVWAPHDAIQKAFEVSPTLAAQPKLLEQIMTTGWQSNDIIKDPIRYDFLTWVIRTELFESGLWTSEKDVSDMFEKVNFELDEAFQNGALKKAEGRIQILASTGGYTLDEILKSNMVEQVTMSIGDSLWFNNYIIGFFDDDVAYGTKRGPYDMTLVNRVLHMENDVNVVEGRGFVRGLVQVIMVVYRIVNTMLVIVMVVYTVFLIVKIIREKGKYFKKHRDAIWCVVTGWVFMGVAIVYSFATAWFFINEAGVAISERTFVFYRVGVPALITLALMSIMVGFCLDSKKKKEV